MTADPFAVAADLLDPPVSPYTADPAGWITVRLHERLWSAQHTICQAIIDHPKVAVQASHDTGKARPLTATVPTPNGWTTMGELKPGDKVLDEEGRPTTVVAKSPVWRLPCYRVLFDDDTTEVVNGVHEWTVHDLRIRPRGIADWRDHWDRAKTYTTDELRTEGVTFGGQRRWRVPTCRPLDLPEADLPIDPYVLGAWLGDGDSKRPYITCHDDDQEILDRCGSLGENVERLYSAPYRWSLSGPLADRPLLLHRLRDLNVLDNKHIPTAYLRASYRQRVELLRGIMDTDGSVDSRSVSSSVSLDLCDERLANDVAELIRTLGWKVRIRKRPATLYGVEVGVRYRMQWHTDVNPFHLARKAALWSPRGVQGSAHTVRTIVSITPTETVDTVCIEVDSPRHLYLAGEGMVPTHNSHLLSRIMAWWIDIHPPGEAFIVSTAPTFNQVRAILWRYLNRAATQAKKVGEPLPGRVLQTEWHIGNEIVGYGRKPANTDEHGFQGIHARYVLVVVDEACGVPETLWTGVEAITTTRDARIVAIGNPDDPLSTFAKNCRAGSGWHTVGVDGLATPNMSVESLSAAAADLGLTDEQTGLLLAEARDAGCPETDADREPVSDDLRAHLLQPVWVADKVRAWGIESPLWVAKVRGQFPSETSDGVIPLGWVTRAQERWRDLADTDQLTAVPQTCIGVDVARYGADKTVLAVRHGNTVVNLEVYAQLSIPQTARKVLAALDGGRVVVDADGLGSGVHDQLEEAGVDTYAFHAMRTTHRRDSSGELRFGDARSAAWWHLRELLDPASGAEVALPDDEELAAELTTPGWEVRTGGKVKVESKQDYKKRLGRSSDRADAVVYAFWDVPKGRVYRGLVAEGEQGESIAGTLGGVEWRKGYEPRPGDRKGSAVF